MAQRRMFSKDVVCSDAFLAMPPSTRELYFQLGMEADDDGFVTPLKVVRMCGASDDELKLLIGKRFLIQFGSGVVVVKHWKINNYIQSDRYKETRYLDEKNGLTTKENGSYTECIQTGYNSDTQVRLGKVSIGKTSTEEKYTSPKGDGALVNELINLFKDLNPSYQLFFKRKPQREAAERLLKLHPLDWWTNFMPAYVQALNDRYCPRAATPIKMEERLGDIEHYGRRKKNEKLTKSANVAFV